MQFNKYRWSVGDIGIKIMFVLALCFVVLFFLPPKLSPTQNASCLVGQSPQSFEVKDLPSAVSYDEDQKATLYDIRPHVLVRANVPVDAKSAKSGEENWIVIDNIRQKVASSMLKHTINVGEYRDRPGYDIVIPTADGGVYAGSVDNGQGMYRRYILLIKRETMFVNNKEIFIADVYVRKEIYDQQVIENSVNDIFQCLKGSEVDAGSIYFPKQEVSQTKKELQLEYFLLQKYNMLALHCKPAVYLYPPKAQMVNVKVYPAGELTYTDPPYDATKGWNVFAYPEGKLVSYGADSFLRRYDYLYFESKVRDVVIKKPTEGWVIKSLDSGPNFANPLRPGFADHEATLGKQAGKTDDWFANQERLFREILPKLGLKNVQENDFIEYWKKALPYAPYYFIGIIDPKNVDEIEALEISPKPDLVNRVRIYFERLENPKVVQAPQINNNPFHLDANKFTVVEWGGMVKNDLEHPFTCSQ